MFTASTPASADPYGLNGQDFQLPHLAHAGAPAAHARAVVGVSRRERKNTLQEAFETFTMDAEAAAPAHHSLSPEMNDPMFEEDMLLVLLNSGEVSSEEQEAMWQTSGGHNTMHHPGPEQQRQQQLLRDPFGPMTSLPDFFPQHTPAHHEHILPQATQQHMMMQASPLPQFSVAPQFASSLAPPPPQPPPPRMPSSQNKYAAAVGAALGLSLRDDFCALQLASTCGQPGSSVAAVHTRIELLDGRLSEAVSELLTQMAYPPAKARAIARGDVSSCSEVEARGLEKLLGHKRDIMALFKRMLDESTAATAGAGSSRRNTADSAYPSPANTDHSSSTHVRFPGSPIAGRPGGGGGSSGASGAQGEFYVSLALSLDTDVWLEDRFKRQLSASACQLWALMNLVNPHPSRQVKEGLAQYTGRSMKQVTDWFTNWRARHWKKIINNL